MKQTHNFYMITNMLIYLLDTIFPTYNNLANECISAFIGPLLDHRQMKETRVLSNEFFLKYCLSGYIFIVMDIETF